jgi:hypothetical protein
VVDAEDVTVGVHTFMAPSSGSQTGVGFAARRRHGFRRRGDEKFTRQVAVMERPKDTQQLLSLVASGSRLLAKL